MENGGVQFETRSSGTLTREIAKQGYSGDADVFAVYAPAMERVFIVPIEEAPSTTMRIRVRDAKKDSPKINWTEDYRFGRWVNELKTAE